MNYIIDLDGTLMDGATPLQGAKAFIQSLSQNRIPYLVMTNSVKSPGAIQKRLKSAGISIEIDNILNPIVAINAYAKSMNMKKIYAVGSQLELSQLKELDIVPPENIDQSLNGIVLLDFERENFGYETLQIIVDAILNGIPVMTASKSLFYRKGNQRAIDTGAFVNLIEQVTEEKITVLGKPSREYFSVGINLLKTTSDKVTVIGDDWQTDVLGANQMGCQSILVRTGKYLKGDENKGNPTRCIDSLEEVIYV